MLYEDMIYGTTEITEPVVLELINCPSLQRLKGIDQAGYFHPYFKAIPRSRFNHSLGVYLLLKKYGAPLEEQLSGLLHDVSHGAFSHCLDYVLEGGNQKEQSHQDNIFESFIKKTEIPDILKKYNMDIDHIVDDIHFPLKETTLPDLCADRIDYSLRDAWHLGELSHEDIRLILNHLMVKDTKRIFTDLESAKIYATLFHKMNEKYYAGIESAAMYQTVGDCLKCAWKKGYINIDDIYMTDKHVLDKITAHVDTDDQLSLYRQRMNNLIPFKNDPDNFDFQLFCKSRMVDPLFMDGDDIKRISEVDEGWKSRIQKSSPAKEYFLKFER